jgi:SAM-dependent methyltransferase
MGIDTHSLNLLRCARAKYGDLGNTITLGRLAVLLGPKAMQRWAGSKSGTYCEQLLIDHFGASHVDSIDNSAYEGATIVADMNKPLPSQLDHQYDTVIDFGCTEHIFDVAQSYRNITSLCKPGGRLMHVVPSNGYCGHGFYQFSPEFFFSRYSQANGYADTEVYLAELIDPRHLYRVPPPSNGKRINVRSIDEMYVLAIARYTGATEVRTQQSDYVFTWSRADHDAELPHAPGKLARLAEVVSGSPILSKYWRRLDARLAANGAHLLRHHPGLARIDVASLLRSA